MKSCFREAGLCTGYTVLFIWGWGTRGRKIPVVLFMLKPEAHLLHKTTADRRCAEGEAYAPKDLKNQNQTHGNVYQEEKLGCPGRSGQAHEHLEPTEVRLSPVRLNRETYLSSQSERSEILSSNSPAAPHQV